MPLTTEFKVTPTAIPGLLVIDITLLKDNRGWFQEKFQKEKLVAAGLPPDFNVVQQGVSYNKEVGVTRGFHAEPWEKFISVINGRIFAAYVDLRPGAGFGAKVTFDIDSTKAIFIPRGVANSYQTLVPGVYYSYLVNAHWSPDGKYQSVNLADPDLNIAWPIPLNKAIVSDKDKNHPMLKGIK